MLKLKSFTVLTCAMLLFTACSGPTVPPPNSPTTPTTPTPPSTSDVIVKPEARVMDAGTRAALTQFKPVGTGPVKMYELRYQATPRLLPWA